MRCKADLRSGLKTSSTSKKPSKTAKRSALRPLACLSSILPFSSSVVQSPPHPLLTKPFITHKELLRISSWCAHTLVTHEQKSSLLEQELLSTRELLARCEHERDTARQSLESITELRQGLARCQQACVPHRPISSCSSLALPVLTTIAFVLSQ